MNATRVPSRVAAVPRNTAWLFAGRVLGQGLAVILTVLLAARLGVVGLGQYTFVNAVVLLANVGTTFGTDMVLIREIAGEGRLDGWFAALVVQVALSVAAIVLIWSVAPFLPGQSDAVVAALRVLSISLLPAALFSVCTAVLRGVGMMRAYAALGAAATAVQLAAVAAIVGVGATVVRAAGALLVGQIVIAAIAWAVCARRLPELRSRPRASMADTRAMARASTSIGVLGLLGILYQRLGAIAVSVMVGPAETGWYAAASRVAEASKTGHLALFGAVYPAMAEARADGQDPTAPGRLRWSWRVCVGCGALVSVGLIVLGPFLIEHLYGPAFHPATTAITILALTIVPSTVATYQSLALLADHREHETLWILVVSLVVLAVLLGALIATMGWIGACWAVLGAETVRAGLMLLTRFGPQGDRSAPSGLVSSTAPSVGGEA